MVRLSAEASFQRAECMRKDWNKKKYTSYTALALAYDVSIVYARNVVLGLKCVRIDPPGNGWKYLMLEGIKYAIYKDGRLWSCSTNSFKRISPNDDGYLTIRLTRADGKGNRKYSIHRLVLTVFDRPPKPGEQARHKDDDPSNNHISNLKWGYLEDNVKDKLKNGGVPIGEETGSSKLTEKRVLKIVRLFNKQSLSAYSFAKQYTADTGSDIGLSTIVDILNGSSWSHVTGIRSNRVPSNRNVIPKKIVKAVHSNYAKVSGDKIDYSKAFAKFLKSKGYDIGWKTVMKILDGTICQAIKP